MKSFLPLLFTSIFVLTNCQVFESLNSVSTSISGASTSLNSISKISDSVMSISGSLQSISGSSSGAAKSQLQVYKMDIRDITASYFRTGFDKEFKSDLQFIANKNGILNWQTDSTTYVAIGEGLKKANMKEYDFKLFLANLKSPDKNLEKFLSDGFYSSIN